MRILIISNTPWNDNNSFGNSFSNIFGGGFDYEIANIYCQPGIPKNSLVSRYYQITEKEIIKSLLHKQTTCGHEVVDTSHSSTLTGSEQKGLKKAKILRWQIFFWLRDALWATKKWKTPELDEFIKSFNPDLIFQPVYYSSYINEIGLHAAALTGKPIIGYISDDCYTLRQYSLSPLFWIDRLWKRQYVKRAIDRCQLLYVITERQRTEYNQIFDDKCKVLFKGGDFDEEFTAKAPGDPIELLYTGNIGSGRWKTLAAIASALKKINNGGQKAQLKIYTSTPLTSKMRAALNIDDASEVCPPVDVSKVKTLQRRADILVHVEPFEKSERYKARLSFSTKIVDYLEAGRCILAVGWEETGGIEYMRENDAAITVTDKSKIYNELSRLIETPSLIKEYGAKAYECGRHNHRNDIIRQRLYSDLKHIAQRGQN